MTPASDPGVAEAPEFAARRPRIPAFDLMRGYFLFVIITNHLLLAPNLVELVTGRGALPASAAEGFYVISGIMVGYVTVPRFARHGFWAASRTVWRRTALIACCAVVLMLIRLIAALRYGSSIEVGEVVDAFLLRGTGGFYADFLALYAVAMAFAPLVIALVLRGRDWLAVLLATVPWAIGSFVPGIEHDDAMKLCWPLLFVVGICIGARWPALTERWRRLAQRTRRRTGSVFIVVFVVSALAFEFLIFWNHHLLVAFADQMPVLVREGLFGVERTFLDAWAWFEPLQSKRTLGPARLLIGALWFAGLFMLMNRYGERLDARLGHLFSFFGTNALAGYMIHSIVIDCLYWPFAADRVRGIDSIVLNTAVVLATVLLVVILLKGWIRVKRAVAPRVRAGSRPVLPTPP